MKSIDKNILYFLSFLIVARIVIWVFGIINPERLLLIDNQRYINIFPLLLMLLAILFNNISSREQIAAINQTTRHYIEEMWTIEKNKRKIGTQSLIEELKYNKSVVGEYIQHTEVGSNVKEEGTFSWEWNVPHFRAYEKDLSTACQGDLETSRKITSLYAQLEACKTIIYFTHQLLANNIFEVKIFVSIGPQGNGEKPLEREVKRHNQQLYNISKNIENSFDELIQKIETC